MLPLRGYSAPSSAGSARLPGGRSRNWSGCPPRGSCLPLSGRRGPVRWSIRNGNSPTATPTGDFSIPEDGPRERKGCRILRRLAGGCGRGRPRPRNPGGAPFRRATRSSAGGRRRQRVQTRTDRSGADRPSGRWHPAGSGAGPAGARRRPVQNLPPLPSSLRGAGVSVGCGRLRSGRRPHPG